jgi:hypothetical protein
MNNTFCLNNIDYTFELTNKENLFRTNKHIVFYNTPHKLFNVSFVDVDVLVQWILLIFLFQFLRMSF